MIYDREVAREAQNQPLEEPILVVADSFAVGCDSRDTLRLAYCEAPEDILRHERMNCTAYQVQDLVPETSVKQDLDAALSLHIM